MTYFFLAKQSVQKNIKVKGQAEIALSNPMGRAKNISLKEKR